MPLDKIIINDLLVRGIVGVNEWEREEKQDILINLVLFSDVRKAAVQDAIEHCVNYRTVAKSVLVHVESARRFTVEALAQDIAKICLERTEVLRVIVRVEKPGAVRYSRSVGVEIDRSGADFA